MPRFRFRSTSCATVSVSVSVLNSWPCRLQFRAQFGVVLDDAVVHERHARGAVRMRVALGRRAMRRPARVADAGACRSAARAPARRPDCRACPRRGGARCGRSPAWRCRRCHSRDIPAAAAHPGCSGAAGLRADDANNAAHSVSFPSQLPPPASPPRGPASAPAARAPAPARPAATSSVITLPAATMAPSPTVTGATSATSEPTKTSRADRRAMLVVAVVIAGDRAGADIGAGADRRRRRDRSGGWPSRPAPSVRRLHLDEIADMHVVLRARCRAAAGRTGR